MELTERQEKEHIKFFEDMKKELELKLEDASVETICKIKEFIEKILSVGTLPSYEEYLLAGDDIRRFLMPYEQGESEMDDLYLARIETPRNIAIQLCLVNLRNRQKNIDDIIESSDRVKKTTLLLITHHQPRSDYGLEPGDLKNSASLNHELRKQLFNSTGIELKRHESYTPYYSALFENSHFLYFIGKIWKPSRPYIYLYALKKITLIDLLRVEIEATHKNNPKGRDAAFKELIENFTIYEKKLRKINGSLAKLKDPLYAELKEYIVNRGFSINKNTGTEILFDPVSSLIIKQIRTIEKRVEQRKFREKDTQTQINFKVYTLPKGYLHHDEFTRKKSTLFNSLINKFLAIGTKHINKAIALNKNHPYDKSSNTKSTIRVPKATHLKIKNLAKQHRITQELLINIIIQDNKNNYASFLEKTRKNQAFPESQKQIADMQAPAAHCEKTPPPQASTSTSTSTTYNAQPTKEQIATSLSNKSNKEKSGTMQAVNNLATILRAIATNDENQI